MNTCLSHNTALSCLRSCAVLDVQLPQAKIRNIPSQAVIDETALQPLHRLSVPLKPIDMLVPSEKERRHNERIRAHAWPYGIPPNSFLALTPTTFVSSPEFCFLQMAGRLSIPKLIQLGFELCGRYVLLAPKHPLNQNPGVLRKPLTTPHRIEAFLKQMKGANGYAKATQALRWIVPNSWSPMETDTTLLLCLATKMGGYQFDVPQLNRKVYLPSHLANRLGKRYVRLDISWDDTRTSSGTKQKNLPVELDASWNDHLIALEFNGDSHLSKMQAGKDRSRELALKELDIDLTVVTEYQVLRMQEFDALARYLRNRLGKRFYPPSKTQMEKKLFLRRELFERFGEDALIG